MKKRPNDEWQELEIMLRSMPRDKVAYAIINTFMKVEDPSDEHCNQFWSWLCSPENAEAKEKAMERCFNEFLALEEAGLSTQLQEHIKRQRALTALDIK